MFFVFVFLFLFFYKVVKLVGRGSFINGAYPVYFFFSYCNQYHISGATLWDPLEIIGANDGFPPLTYAQFCHVTRAVGPPPRPLPDVDLKVRGYA